MPLGAALSETDTVADDAASRRTHSRSPRRSVTDHDELGVIARTTSHAPAVGKL
jgi:hypothetical protein